MSRRDQEFVDALGIPVAQLAEAMDKSRQTVNRGIRAEGEYFKPTDLARALECWRRENIELYTIAKAKICDIYPGMSEAILQAAGIHDSSAFSKDAGGEYWFICGDFVGFRNNLPACAKQLEDLCSSEDAQVKIFVNDRDMISAQRLALKFKENYTHVILCKTLDLRLFPSTLLRMDDNDQMDLFGASDTGFVPLSRQEAARLRVFLRELEGANAD